MHAYSTTNHFRCVIKPLSPPAFAHASLVQCFRNLSTLAADGGHDKRAARRRLGCRTYGQRHAGDRSAAAVISACGSTFRVCVGSGKER
jgi:hypothetical protein